MFGRKKREKDGKSPPPLDILEDKGDDPSSPLYWRNHVMNLAKAKGEDILTKSQEYFNTCVDEDKRQRDGFLFSCRRHGDFLTVEITRNGNPEGEHYNRFFAQTWNLGKISRIGMVEGNPVDYLGYVKFKIDVYSNSDYTLSRNDIYNRHSIWDTISKGCGYELHSVVEYVYKSRPIIINLDNSSGIYVSERGELIDYIVENYPRPSRDDVIDFYPLNVKIPVPHGMGKQVLNQILTELERGSNREPIVIEK